jgi:predicted phosphodiesterase
MRILPLSDLHLELTSTDWDLPELPEFDVLVMAGDLCPGMAAGVEWLAERIGDRHAVYSAGNHEFYGHRDVDVTIAEARSAAAGTNVHVLADTSVDLLGTTFIGATLWTDFALLGHPDHAMAVASEFMNDYRQIFDGGHLLRPSDTLARHMASREFIADELTRTNDGRRRVVVTHHGIHADAVRPGMRGRPISSAYSSAMEDFVRYSNSDLWIYGHVHKSDDRMIGRTRVVSNPKGYGPSKSRPRHDNESFDPTLIIEI